MFDIQKEIVSVMMCSSANDPADITDSGLESDMDELASSTASERNALLCVHPQRVFCIASTVLIEPRGCHHCHSLFML